MVALQRSFALWPFLLMLGGQSFPALAQVVPDATLGAESSQVQVQGNQVTIGNGASRGAALFHSFDQFNVADGQQVLFASPQGIEAILGRVTGSTPSNIDGTLGVLGAADLFLLNPNGILFGPNAQLDIAGSFTASTGDDVQVGDITFSATAPDSVPLLSVNVSPGIQLGTARRGRIQNQASLTLPPEQSLTFASDTIEQDGQISIPRGTVELRGRTLSLTGDINTRDANNQLGELRLTSPDNLTVAATAPLTNQAIAQALQNNAVVVESDRNLSLVGALTSPSSSPLTLISGNNLNILPNNSDGVVHLAGDAILQSGNNILIENQIFVTDLNFFRLSTNSEGPFTFTTDDQLARSIILQADGDVIIRDTPETTRLGPLNQQPNMLFLEGNNRNQGSISIQANSVTMQSNGFVKTFQGTPLLVISSTIIRGQRGGDVNIDVAEDFTLIGNSALYITAGEGQDTGNINVNVGHSVYLDNESSILTNHYASNGAGQTGTIGIEAGNTILLQGSVVSTTSFSQSGDISLNAPHIILDGSDRQAAIAAGTVFMSPNNAGNVTLNATESLQLIGNQPDLLPIPDLQQIALENIVIQASNSTSIQATALGLGASGQIAVNTPQLRLQDGAIIANAIGLQGNSSGSGDVVINADDIQLRQSILANGTLGSEDAGRLEINSDRIRLDDGAIIGVSSALGAGDAGELIIRTGELVVAGGSAIAANSENGGSGGLLDIQAQSILVEGTAVDGLVSSRLLTDVTPNSTGPGGSLHIQADTLAVLNGGQIRASTQGPENAGNININATHIMVSGTSPNGIPSAIEAQAINGDTDLPLGKAGTLRVRGNRLAIREQGQLNTQSASGNGGNIILVLDEALVLRRQGQITATAGTARSGGGDGGNITIDAGFIVAPGTENSDITANAFAGNGGNIDITTNALLLGIAPRGQSTSLSDITASSGPGGVDGTITIAGVVEDLAPEPLDLPTGLVEEGDRIASGCLLDEDASFVVTGRGGIPANSRDILSQVLFWDDSRISDEMRSAVISAKHQQAILHSDSIDDVGFPEQSPYRALPQTNTQPLDLPIREVQSWQINAQGKVELIAMQELQNQSHPECYG